MSARIRGNSDGQRGQGLVELALLLPIMLLLVVGVAELGVIFGNSQSLIYGSREGARVGSALVKGNASLCTVDEEDPSRVDGALVAAVQRILKSPDSGISLDKVIEIQIFPATSTGAPVSQASITKWTYLPNGYDIDPDASVDEMIDFFPTTIGTWRPCDRRNTGNPPESIGVSVAYRYEFVMPLASVVNAVAGGRANMTLKETTVMALNPTIV